MNILLILTIGLFFTIIFAKILYKFMILILAALNEDAKWDYCKKEQLLRFAKNDKVWRDVSEYLGIWVELK